VSEEIERRNNDTKYPRHEDLVREVSYSWKGIEKQVKLIIIYLLLKQTNKQVGEG
jgi:hypothetical protein